MALRIADFFEANDFFTIYQFWKTIIIMINYEVLNLYAVYLLNVFMCSLHINEPMENALLVAINFYNVAELIRPIRLLNSQQKDQHLKHKTSLHVATTSG